MAITIEQQPSSPQYSRGPIVFVLSSTNINETGFTFVADVTVGSTTFRYRKQPNPTQRGIFNFSSVVDSNLDWELSALGASILVTSVDCAKEFSIVFSEEFQNAMGMLEVQNPTSAQSFVSVKGYKEFDSSNLTESEYTSDTILTNLPNNNNFELKTGETALISYWDESANTVMHQPITNASSSVVIDGITITSSDDTLNTISNRFFHWVNRDGGWDSFRFTELEEQTDSVSNRSAVASEITHGFTNSSNRQPGNSNVWKSTGNVYSSTYSSSITTNSRWLTEEESEMVAGIFDSQSVYIQEGSNFRPVTVVSTSYPRQRQTRTGQLFSHQLNWRYTNNKRGN